MRNVRVKSFLSLLCPLALFGQAAPQLSSRNSVAIVAGQPISEEELTQSLGPQLLQLRNEEYDVKSKALESLIRHKVVEAEARKRNITLEKLIEQEVDSKVADPTDGEIDAYALGQNRPGARLED